MKTVTVDLRERLWALLEPLLTRLGYELGRWALTVANQSRLADVPAMAATA